MREKDEKELKQIEIIQKEITQRKYDLTNNLGLPILALIIGIGFVSFSYIQNDKNIAFAKQGLEECPNFKNLGKTIWVKDCLKLTIESKKK